MKKHWAKSLLLASLLLGVGLAHAETVPTPPKAPPRVPFTAFRTKPKLELRTPEGKEQANSLVVQDVTVKQKTPAKTIRIKPVEGFENTTKVLPTPTAKPEYSDDDRKRELEDIIFSPQIAMPEPSSVNTNQYLKLVAVPIPPRKPGQESVVRTNTVRANSGFVAIDRIMATPAEETQPQPAEKPRSPEVVPLNQQEIVEAPPIDAATPPVPDQDIPDTQPTVRVPPVKPRIDDVGSVTTVRIRDNNRFSAHSRMAGGGSDVSGGGSKTISVTPSGSLRSLGLPDDMQNLRLGSLGQGKGVSPVLMPGQKVTKAAPDDKRIGDQGIPNEVVVFFIENSSDLEVGQMDIVNNDVVAMLKNRPDLNLEIVGYSEPQGGTESTDKMALSRALMIRQYLSRQNISQDRLSVREKGDKTSIEPRDRVEMYFDR